ncbi:Sulfate transporter family protein [Candida albicans]|uniref:Sulfate transporter family protein n=1 Tax=Candida albicans TaxID=5476 RepID=A0A8H6F2P0_CANAX|nr:Sulfate transporter family protein [Candida albicans]
MTGSAFNIITGQVPGLMGYNNSTVDAAFGLIPLFILYLWKFSTDYAQKRYPRHKMYFFYFQQLRNAIVIIVATAISWGIVHPKKVAFNGPSSKFKPPIKTIGDVPSGLRHVGVMSIPDGIISAMASEIPVSTVILLLEHIAISKSFGRINDYKVVPDQEVIAIGVNNLIGTFFNAYPATGSFSRSALKAKCGVRTPLTGIFTGAVVLLALYALTKAFYYIPKATLSAVIIHAVSDLIANYKITWSFWKMSPIDCGIFLIAVILTVFVTIEAVAIPHGQFLGKIQIAEVVNPIIEQTGSHDEHNASASDGTSYSSDLEIHQVLSEGTNYKSTDEAGKLKAKEDIKPVEGVTTSALQRNNPQVKFHTRWVPLNNENINAGIKVQPPPPGKPFDYSKIGSRPWNDPGPLRWNLPWSKKEKVEEKVEDNRPILRIVHFDFSTVASIDVTAIQALVDLRKALNAYADREVEFHFSGILSPWIRRGLLNAGFGTYEDGLLSTNNYVNIAAGYKDLEDHVDEPYYAATGTNTPFFHLDIPNYS